MLGFGVLAGLGAYFVDKLNVGSVLQVPGGFLGGGMAAGEQRWLLLWGISWRQSPRAILKFFCM